MHQLCIGPSNDHRARGGDVSCSVKVAEQHSFLYSLGRSRRRSLGVVAVSCRVFVVLCCALNPWEFNFSNFYFFAYQQVTQASDLQKIFLYNLQIFIKTLFDVPLTTF